MTVKEVLKHYHNIEIELLLAHVLKKPKEFVFLHGENRLTRIQADKLTRMVKRRMRGEPIAYILGYKDFYGLRFKVNKNVLIPRPETELVVDLVSGVIARSSPEHYKATKQSIAGKRLLRHSDARMPRNDIIKILDVGTGSGCIAVSLAKQFSIFNFQFSIAASDISAKALAVAKQNAKTVLGKNFHTSQYQSFLPSVKFIKSDLLGGIKFVPDIIIANLPYGWKDWKNESSVETKGLRFEPQHALFTKEGGLYLYRKLMEQVAARENLPKLIYLEIDPRQKGAILALIRKILPKAGVKFYRDYANHWRYAEITL